MRRGSSVCNNGTAPASQTRDGGNHIFAPATSHPTDRSRCRAMTIALSSRRAAGTLVALSLAVLSTAVASLPAAAATPAHGRITRGDVVAAFQARTTGGYLNSLRGHVVAAPVRGLVDGRINFFTDGTYCATDWHYLGVTLLGDGGRSAAAAYLRQTTVTFAIDGQTVSPTMRTAVKPFVGTGIRGQFGVSTGKLLAPGSIAEGTHTLTTTIVTPDGGPEVLPVTFVLTEGACG